MNIVFTYGRPIKRGMTPQKLRSFGLSHAAIWGMRPFFMAILRRNIEHDQPMELKGTPLKLCVTAASGQIITASGTKKSGDNWCLATLICTLTCNPPEPFSLFPELIKLAKRKTCLQRLDLQCIRDDSNMSVLTFADVNTKFNVLAVTQYYERGIPPTPCTLFTVHIYVFCLLMAYHCSTINSEYQLHGIYRNLQNLQDHIFPQNTMVVWQLFNSDNSWSQSDMCDMLCYYDQVSMYHYG